MTLPFELLAALLLFSIGLYGVISRKDFLRIFFALEILLNAVILLLAISAKAYQWTQALPLAYLVMALATLEAAAGVLIFIAAHRITQQRQPDDIRSPSQEGSSHEH
jgi:NADH:ubiquinone oxidoreductase subunit K